MASLQLRELSVSFSVEIIKLCDTVNRHPALMNQLERAATSIGANIHEANYAHSRADFIAKLQIALKECFETEYWLEVFMKAGVIEKVKVNALFDQCGILRRMMVASINIAKKNLTDGSSFIKSDNVKDKI